MILEISVGSGAGLPVESMSPAIATKAKRPMISVAAISFFIP